MQSIETAADIDRNILNINSGLTGVARQAENVQLLGDEIAGLTQTINQQLRQFSAQRS